MPVRFEPKFRIGEVRVLDAPGPRTYGTFDVLPWVSRAEQDQIARIVQAAPQTLKALQDAALLMFRGHAAMVQAVHIMKDAFFQATGWNLVIDPNGVDEGRPVEQFKPLAEHACDFENADATLTLEDGRKVCVTCGAFKVDQPALPEVQP